MFDEASYRRTLTFQKHLLYGLQWKPFKNDEKCFSLHLKSRFRSQIIWIFALNFWSYRKTNFIKMIRLIPKFMTSQHGKQTIKITIHILPNISRSECNQSLKFDKLIEVNKRNIFSKTNHAEMEVRNKETSLRPFFVFSKKLYII